MKMVLDGRFEVEDTVSKSANGEVYRCHDLRTKKIVALKVLRPRFLVGENFGARLRQEFRVLRSLHHPNIVRVLDAGVTQDNLHYFAMEFVSGRTLDKLVEEEGPLSPIRVARYLDQLASALDVAHAQQIIHRDLNPKNIMVSGERMGVEAIKILDFGMAKVQGSDRFNISLASTGMAKLLGDPVFMSPEQAMGRDSSKLSDIYTLGITLYYLLVGQPPFVERTPIDTMIAQTKSLPPPMEERNPEVQVPPAVEEVVRFALEKNPANRPQTAGQLAAYFREAVNNPHSDVVQRAKASARLDPPVIPEQSRVTRRRHNDMILVLLVGGVMALLGAFLFMLAILR